MVPAGAGEHNVVAPKDLGAGALRRAGIVSRAEDSGASADC